MRALPPTGTAAPLPTQQQQQDDASCSVQRTRLSIGTTGQFNTASACMGPCAGPHSGRKFAGAQISYPWLMRQLSQHEQLVGVHCTPHTGPGGMTPQHHARPWRTCTRRIKRDNGLATPFRAWFACEHSVSQPGPGTPPGPGGDWSSWDPAAGYFRGPRIVATSPQANHSHLT